jgi:nitroreductase
MDFIDLARKRASVRAYTTQAVEAEKLEQILEAGRIAPTAANIQPQRFLVIQDSAGMAKLATACRPHGAPAAIVVLGDRKNVWVRPFDQKDMVDIDTSIACDHMMLAATDLGLGTCWLTYFDPVAIRRAFNIPEGLVPVHVLVLGYAKGPSASPERHATERKPLAELVTWGSY